ncbi:chorismate mutase [Rummeliibacillus sp. G93]|uniref:chorismate mutase n=1 Tax=Rummeliibacillus sp. G93 TaxID=2939494 RepID=UPI00201BDB4C|nr:chorismate mutase [Rummeliibacillus sp. G93]UQW98537.1 chorismate mutase [Rummeliibacillus sp. G93]
MIRGIRGASTIAYDNPALVMQETKNLMERIIKDNEVLPENVASVIISTTADIVSAFPAKAIRSLPKWEYVPVMCTHEMNVPNGLPLCIRVLVHVNTTVPQNEIKHIYLNEAVKLRPDLTK